MTKEEFDKLRCEPIKLFNKEVLYADLRVNNLHLPDNIYRYELRHDDKCQGILCEIAHRILVNFQGTILSDKKINLGKQGYRLIDEDKDIQYLDKDNMTVNDYLHQQEIYNEWKDNLNISFSILIGIPKVD